MAQERTYVYIRMARPFTGNGIPLMHRRGAVHVFYLSVCLSLSLSSAHSFYLSLCLFDNPGMVSHNIIIGSDDGVLLHLPYMPRATHLQ